MFFLSIKHVAINLFTLHVETDLSNLFLQGTMSTEPCVYFNSPSGCWFGDHCRFTHVKGVAPRCRFYR